MKVRQGDPRPYVVSWNVEPQTILNSLVKDIPIESGVLKGAYRIRVSRDLPFLFHIVSVQAGEEIAPN
jgi:hypothetical protein